MAFTNIEQRVLEAVWSRARHQKPASAQALDEAFQFLSRFPEMFQFTAGPRDWTDAISSLVDKGILIHQADGYALAEQGRSPARQCAKAFSGRDFSTILLRCEQSGAYSTFCERVYGRDLDQHSMMTMRQLDRLLAVLDLDGHNRVLDMGCGSGRIAEHISDVTQAHVTGIDLAWGAIGRAQTRTAGKRARLTFKVGDMDELAFPANSFDTILAIDTMYFVEDRPKTVARMQQILQPGGQMGVFYTQSVKLGASKDRLQPEKTEMAQALGEACLDFRFWDLTRQEGEFWKRFVTVAEKLKPAFEAEGNTELYELMFSEGRDQAAAVVDGRVTRYLYHVVA